MIGALKKGQWNRAHATMDSTIFLPVFFTSCPDRCNTSRGTYEFFNIYINFFRNTLKMESEINRWEDLSHIEGQLGNWRVCLNFITQDADVMVMLCSKKGLRSCRKRRKSVRKRKGRKGYVNLRVLLKFNIIQEDGFNELSFCMFTFK